MKIMKMVQIPAREKEQVIQTLCDICQLDVNRDVGNWDRDDVKIEREYGTSYPECGHATYRTFDLCGKCFEIHLVPFLQSKGAKVDEREVSW